MSNKEGYYQKRLYYLSRTIFDSVFIYYIKINLTKIAVYAFIPALWKAAAEGCAFKSSQGN